MEINFNENLLNWDKFIKNSDQSNIFVTSKFLKSLGVNFNIVTCYDNNVIVAGLPIILDENNKPICNNQPFTQYIGICLSKDLCRNNLNYNEKITKEYKVINFLIDELIKKYGNFFISLSYKFKDLRPFQWFNFGSKPNFQIDIRYTGIIQTNKYKSFDDYLGFVRKVRKQELKKSNIEVEIINSQDVDVLDNLHNLTFERQGIKRSKSDSLLLKSIAKSSIEENYGKIYFGNHDNKTISSILILSDENTDYYLISANHPEYRKLNANGLLLFNAIENTFKKGFDCFDFVGLNSPNRSDYKISFNCDIFQYHAVKI
jgi:hypothetical protein